MLPSDDSSLARWNPQECPFAVEYVRRVLDDIRLAVVDAFFSLPRGGAEIGGLLLGRAEKDRVVITDAIPLECEHAFGPSFTLSETDLARLGVKLAEAGKNASAKPVGWYHSHTRSEIFLSEADLEIHQRFFPEPLQVALVLKPHTFLPTQAGFFFRDQEGVIRADASHREFQLDPLPIGKVPSDEPAAKPAPVPAPSDARVIDISSAAKPEAAVEPEIPSTPVSQPEPPPQPVELAPIVAIAPPTFGMEEPAASRRWLAPVAIVAGLAVGAGGFLTRQLWMPHPSATRPNGTVIAASVGLTTSDSDGQLQIRWNGQAPDVQRSSGAMLFLCEGAVTRSISLDKAQLQSGSYSYQRSSDRVEVVLSLAATGGDKLVQAAGFIQAPPVPPADVPAPMPTAPAGAPAAPDPAIRKERDELRTEVAGLKAANTRLTEANKRMERYIENDRAEHQHKRMENQSPDPK